MSEKTNARPRLDQPIPPLTCPVTPYTWTNDVKKLFDPTDVACMINNGGFDLSNYDDVVANAPQIYAAVKSQWMPLGKTKWTPQMVNIFGCWAQQGFQK